MAVFLINWRGGGLYFPFLSQHLWEKASWFPGSRFQNTPQKTIIFLWFEVFTLMTYENPWLSVWAYLLYSHYSRLPGFTLQMLSPLDQLSRLLDWCWEIDVCPLRGCVHIWGLGVCFLSTRGDSTEYTHKHTPTKGGWVNQRCKHSFGHTYPWHPVSSV